MYIWYIIQIVIILSFSEEVLGTNSAVWMSRDGLLLIFATFNDSLVEEMRFPWYGSISEARLYPDIRSLRYPKPGTRNPIATLTVADLVDTSNIKIKPVIPPTALANRYLNDLLFCL